MERERRERSRDVQRVASELERQKASLEASLRAARTEADCLREQLKNAEVVSQSRRTVTAAVNSRSIGAGGCHLVKKQSPAQIPDCILLHLWVHACGFTSCQHGILIASFNVIGFMLGYTNMEID